MARFNRRNIQRRYIDQLGGREVEFDLTLYGPLGLLGKFPPFPNSLFSFLSGSHYYLPETPLNLGVPIWTARERDISSGKPIDICIECGGAIVKVDGYIKYENPERVNLHYCDSLQMDKERNVCRIMIAGVPLRFTRTRKDSASYLFTFRMNWP